MFFSKNNSIDEVKSILVYEFEKLRKKKERNIYFSR